MYTYAENYKQPYIKVINETKLDKMIPKISNTVYIYDEVYVIGLFLGILSLKNFKQASYIIFFILFI